VKTQRTVTESPFEAGETTMLPARRSWLYTGYTVACDASGWGAETKSEANRVKRVRFIGATGRERD
jgi:hypothetical protein